MPESEVQGQVTSTPPRNGFAAAIIARNAAEGAAEWERPAMADTKDRTIAAQLFHDIPGIDTEAAAAIQDWYERRFTLTPRNRPTNARLNEMIATSYASMTYDATAESFVELLRDDGFEIRAIEGGD